MVWLSGGSGGLLPGLETLASMADTVSVVGMTIDPFGAELRDGRIYGRGACDTKGTMAAMLTSGGKAFLSAYSQMRRRESPMASAVRM